MTPMRPDPVLKASPARLTGALLLALCLAGCAKPQLTVRVNGVALDARGQVRLCGVQQPLDPANGALTATLKGCKGKGDALVVLENAQFADCQFTATGQAQTLVFRIEGVACLAQP